MISSAWSMYNRASSDVSRTMVGLGVLDGIGSGGKVADGTKVDVLVSWGTGVSSSMVGVASIGSSIVAGTHAATRKINSKIRTYGLFTLLV